MSWPISSYFLMHLEWDSGSMNVHWCVDVFILNMSIWFQKFAIWKNLPNQKDVLVLCGTHICWSWIFFQRPRTLGDMLVNKIMH